MTAEDVAIAIENAVIELEDALHDSPFRDEELEDVLSHLYRISLAYDSLAAGFRTCCDTTQEPLHA